MNTAKKLLKCLEALRERGGRLYTHIKEHHLSNTFVTVIKDKGMIERQGANDVWLFEPPTIEITQDIIATAVLYNNGKRQERLKKYDSIPDQKLTLPRMEEKYRTLPGGVSADNVPSPCETCSQFDFCRQFKVACKDYNFYVTYNRCIPNRERYPDKRNYWETSPGLFFLELDNLCRQGMNLREVANTMGVEPKEIGAFFSAWQRKHQKVLL